MAIFPKGGTLQKNTFGKLMRVEEAKRNTIYFKRHMEGRILNRLKLH